LIFLKQGKISKKVALFFVVGIAAFFLLACAGLAALKSWRPLREQGAAVSRKESSQGKMLKGKTAKTEKPKAKPVTSSDFSDFLVCGIDNTQTLTDVIILVGLNNKSKKIFIMQIPRDTYVGGSVPTHKYNAVYGHHKKGVSGMETLKAQIERDFGVKIKSYAAVTTKGFRKVVDAVGGVNLSVPVSMYYDDPYQNLHIHLKKGMQHLDGAKAEQFVRFRKGWLSGDVGRLDAQKLFLAAFAKKLKGAGTVQLAADLLPVVSPPDFVTDLSAYEMLELYASVKDIALKNARVCTMPGEGYRGKSGASFYSVDKKALTALLNRGFVPPGVRLTPAELKIEQKTDTVSSDDQGNDLNKLLKKAEKPHK
jgi:polyisoprenyl-teichoic acid--peptidoglycan teichoic acid transferase